MKIKLNLVAGEKTVNERIYSEEALKEAFGKIKDLPITMFPGRDGVVNVRDIIAFANIDADEIKESEPILMDARPLNKDLMEKFKDNEFTISAVGEVVEKNKLYGANNEVIASTKYVEDITIVQLFPVLKNQEEKGI